MAGAPSPGRTSTNVSLPPPHRDGDEKPLCMEGKMPIACSMIVLGTQASNRWPTSVLSSISRQCPLDSNQAFDLRAVRTNGEKMRGRTSGSIVLTATQWSQFREPDKAAMNCGIHTWRHAELCRPPDVSAVGESRPDNAEAIDLMPGPSQTRRRGKTKPALLRRLSWPRPMVLTAPAEPPRKLSAADVWAPFHADRLPAPKRGVCSTEG